jgi:hypothetical protein
MEYFIFIRNSGGKEKLVGSSPSLEIARRSAEWMANSDGLDVVAALVCAQEEGGVLIDLEFWQRGAEEACDVPPDDVPPE